MTLIIAQQREMEGHKLGRENAAHTQEDERKMKDKRGERGRRVDSICFS